MGALLIVSTPILFFIIAGLFLIGHHALTHEGNFFDIADMNLAFASHESILMLILIFSIGLLVGGFVLN